MKEKYLRNLLYFILVLIFCLKCTGQNTKYQNNTQKRRIMVERQIKDRGIKDEKVLSAMLTVERHKFVLPNQSDYAYNDQPLPIGEGQTISQPYIVALMTEVLQLNESSKVLEIGTGSGYQAAILAEICKMVYSIEIISVLGNRAKKTLVELGYSNIEIKIGDGYLGWEKHAPFDAIIVTCSPTHIPQPLKDQLVEGGKMIIPYGKSNNQKLVLLVKKEGIMIEKGIIPVRFVPMIKEDGKKY